MSGGKYSQGIMSDGPVILKDGWPRTTEYVVQQLNQQAEEIQRLMDDNGVLDAASDVLIDRCDEQAEEIQRLKELLSDAYSDYKSGLGGDKHTMRKIAQAIAPQEQDNGHVQISGEKKMTKVVKVKNEDIWPEVQESIAPKSFGKRLKSIRETMGWTQKDVADLTGLNVAAISHFETGNREPSLKNIVRLCRALRCKPNALIDV